MDSNEVRREWATRSGEFSPEYYAYYGADETSERLRRVLDRYIDRDDAVLELGCSSGRHLAHLYAHGFDDLSGIDVNADAFDVMAETYADLAATGTFYHDTIENVVGDFADGAFDAVISVETLQHIHPDSAWIYPELARITDDLLITVENEGGPDGSGSTDSGVNYVDDGLPLYYRNWHQVFTAVGFVGVTASDDGRDTTRVFRSPTGQPSG